MEHQKPQNGNQYPIRENATSVSKKRSRKPGKMLQKRYNSSNKTGKPDSYHEQPHVMPSVWLFLFRINLLND